MGMNTKSVLCIKNEDNKNGSGQGTIFYYHNHRYNLEIILEYQSKSAPMSVVKTATGSW